MFRYLDIRVGAIYALALTVLFMMQGHQVWAEYPVDHDQIRQETRELYSQNAFATLDELAESYRLTASRTSAGHWHLALFHQALDDRLNIDGNAPAFWNRERERSLHWIRQNKTSAAAYLSHARYLLAYAKSQNSHSEDSLIRLASNDPFPPLLDKARQYLEQHQTIAARDPHYFKIMAEIARLQNRSREDVMTLVEEAALYFPDYFPIYTEAMIYFLPEWHGSNRAVEKFARRVQKLVREEDRQEIYARLYWAASDASYDVELFSRSKVYWPLMKRGLVQILRTYPDQWNINHFAFFACLSGDMHTARHMLARMEGLPNLLAWRKDIYHQKCMELASYQRG